MNTNGLKISKTGRISPDVVKKVEEGVKYWNMTFSEAIEEGLVMWIDQKGAWKPIPEPKKKKK